MKFLTKVSRGLSGLLLISILMFYSALAIQAESDSNVSLASTAAYLSRSGWRRGQAWGTEVSAGGLQPDAGGPRFSVGRNFRAIKRYNNSDNYALGVGHLADRLAGGGPLKNPFGPDRYGLTIDQRKLLQTRLMAKGFDTGGADGVLGPKSKAAIAAYQRSVGLEATGAPSPALLARLG